MVQPSSVLMSGICSSPRVAAGLVPAIHDFLLGRKTWMPATSAGMTINEADSAKYHPFQLPREAVSG
jgi:hypothetical protein